VGDEDEGQGWDLSGPLVTTVGKRVVVVRAFIKKTRKTPNREIEMALKRAKEIGSWPK